MSGLWIWGSPLGGKTTIYKMLQAEYPRVQAWETDEERQKLPGWKHEMFKAWRPDHPLHNYWMKLNKLHQRQMMDAYLGGAIVFSHERPQKGIPNILLYPGPDPMAKRLIDRIERHKREGKESQSIVGSLLHWVQHHLEDREVGLDIDEAYRRIKAWIAENYGDGGDGTDEPSVSPDVHPGVG